MENLIEVKIKSKGDKRLRADIGVGADIAFSNNEYK